MEQLNRRLTAAGNNRGSYKVSPQSGFVCVHDYPKSVETPVLDDDERNDEGYRFLQTLFVQLRNKDSVLEDDR